MARKKKQPEHKPIVVQESYRLIEFVEAFKYPLKVVLVPAGCTYHVKKNEVEIYTKTVGT